MSQTPTDDDIARLARQAGLDLPAEFMPELIEAYGHVRQMTERVAFQTGRVLVLGPVEPPLPKPARLSPCCGAPGASSLPRPVSTNPTLPGAC